MRSKWLGNSALPAIAVGVVACLLASCSSEVASAPESVTVSEGGFEVAQGPMTITGPAGVAPIGSTVTASSSDKALPNDVHEMVEVFSAPVEVKIDNGNTQPAVPVTFSFKLDGAEAQRQVDAGHTPVLLLQSEGSDSVDVLEATWNQDTQTLTGQAPHLSFGWPGFLKPDAIINEVGAAFTSVFGLSFPKPDCVGGSADFTSTSYTVSPVSGDVAWPCIRLNKAAQEGTLGIDLYSNSPYIWKVQTNPDPIETSGSLGDVEAIPAVALYREILDNDADSDRILLPGQSISLDFGQYNMSPKSGVLSYDLGVYLVGLTGYGIGTVMSKFAPGKYQRILEDKAAIQCLIDLSETFNDLQGGLTGARMGDLIKGVIACTGAVGGSVFGAITGLLGGAVMGPLASLVNPRLAAQSASFEVIRTTTDQPAAAATNAGAPGPVVQNARCGQITDPRSGNTLTVTIKSSNVPLECSEAEATFRELLATINDRTWPVGTYICGVLGAGEQEQYGYVITCDDAARGAKIVLGK